MIALSPDDRTALLRIARTAVAAAIAAPATPPAPEQAAPSAALLQHAGAFVTLYSGGELRGCVGYVEARAPLAETVARAGAAVTRDRRFPQLRAAEVPRLTIEVSVLGGTAPIRVEDVVVGTHGLVLRHRGASGLLLPQVPVEHGWDVPTFLEHLCRKAGLPPGSWRAPGAELLAFTSERFSDGA
jgi:AmmeMemoRadiSam system protein A